MSGAWTCTPGSQRWPVRSVIRKHHSTHAGPPAAAGSMLAANPKLAQWEQQKRLQKRIDGLRGKVQVSCALRYLSYVGPIIRCMIWLWSMPTEGTRLRLIESSPWHMLAFRVPAALLKTGNAWIICHTLRRVLPPTLSCLRVAGADYDHQRAAV